MIEYWHNPRCSKSRQALALLEERGAPVTVRRYLEDAPSEAELRQVRAAMGNPAVVAMMRTGGKMFKELTCWCINRNCVSLIGRHRRLVGRCNGRRIAFISRSNCRRFI